MDEVVKSVRVVTLALMPDEDGNTEAVAGLADWMHVVSAAEAHQILKMMEQCLESEAMRFYLLSQASGD